MSVRRRVGLPWIALVIVFGLLVAACGGGDDSGGGGGDADGAKTVNEEGLTGLIEDDSTPTPGGEAVYALGAETANGWCLPEAQLAIQGIQVARAVYDTLTVPNDDGEYVPFLADEITPNDDFTSWTIHLRDGITFHDGSKLDAQVVKDNLDAYRGTFPKRKPQLFIFVFDNVKDTKVVDDLTVQVDMKSPWSSFPAHLYSYGRLGIMAEAQLNAGDDCFKKMIGTGPFKFEGDWQVNDHLTVVKNENYWRTDADGAKLPYLSKLTFKPVTEPTTLVNGMETGQYELTITDSTDVIPDLRDSDKLNMLESTRYPEVAYTLFNTQKPPFNNFLARQAFAYAFNREEYNELRQDGLLQLASGPFGPGVPGYIEDTGLPEYDPEKARELVQQYKDETGEDLKFTYGTTSSAAALQDAQKIQEYMKAAGIDMSIKQVDQTTLINDAIFGNFQANGWRNHPGFDPDTQWVWWHCDDEPAAVNGATNVAPEGPPVNGNNCNNAVNFSKFNDSKINEAFEQARGISDEAQRTTHYETINKQFAENLWEGWGYWSLWTVPAQKNVRGILTLKLPTADSNSAVGDDAITGLAGGIDVAGIWLKK